MFSSIGIDVLSLPSSNKINYRVCSSDKLIRKSGNAPTDFPSEDLNLRANARKATGFDRHYQHSHFMKEPIGM